MDNPQHPVINKDERNQNDTEMIINTPFIHADQCDNNINNKKPDHVKMNSLAEETIACSIKSNENGLVSMTGTVINPENKTLYKDVNDATEITPTSTTTDKEDQDNQKCERKEEDGVKSCTVCGGNANGVYFGALVCLPCKSFYIRSTKDGEPNFTCNCKNGSDKTKQGRTKCQYCRYQQCLIAGMCRKEKPELVQITEGQKLCKVCGDIANGIHFGIDTCEGCKKFFRRGINENKSYTCKGQKNCSINPRNRNNCRYCRYEKCLNEGMSRDAIRMGRPKKQSDHSGNSKMTETDSSYVDKIKSSGQENTSDLKKQYDLSKNNHGNAIIKFNAQAPNNSIKLDHSQLSPSITEEEENRKDVQSILYNLNTPMQRSCELFESESQVTFAIDDELKINGNEVERDIRSDLKIEDPTSTTTKNLHSYSNDLDDLLDFLQSDVILNGGSLNEEHHKVYDAAGQNKYQGSNMSTNNDNQKQNSLSMTTQTCTSSTQYDEYPHQQKSHNDVPTKGNLVENKYTRKSLAEAPKIIFDYQHKHCNFEINGLTNVFAQQRIITPFSSFQHEKSTVEHPNRCTENTGKILNRNLFCGCSPAPNRNYRIDNTARYHTDYQETLTLGHNINGTLQYDQTVDLNRHNLYYTGKDMLGKDDTSILIHSNPDSNTQRQCSSDTSTGESYDDFLNIPSHSVLNTTKYGESHDHTLHIDDQSNSNTNLRYDCISRLSDDNGPAYSNAGNVSSITNTDSPYFDLQSQIRINKLFGNLEENEEETNEPVLVSDAFQQKEKTSFARFYDCLTESSLQSNENVLADKLIKNTIDPVSVPSKRKREMTYQNQDVFLGYLKCKNNFKKNLICGKFNLELTVNYWHQPVQLGNTTRIYEPVLTYLLEEYNKLKLTMDESKQEIEGDCNNVPWPKQLEKAGKHWDHVTRRILRNTTAAMNFFSNVPGFNNMNIEDRKNILNTATFSAANIIAAVHFFNHQEQRYKNFWNWTVPTENPMYPFKLKLLELGSDLSSLNITDMEGVVLLSLLLLSTDWCDLNDPATMEYEREKLIQALQAHCIDKGQDPVDRIQNLFFYMPKVRFLAVWHQQLLTAMKVNSKLQGVETLMNNCHM